MIKVGIGRTAEVFRDGDGSAIKLFYNWMPATEAAHEAAILQKISQACKSAPKFYELCHAEGRSGLRFEFIDGKMAGELMMKNPLQAIDYSRSIAALHRELHSAEAPGLRSGEEIFSAGLRSYQEIDGDTRNRLLDFVHAQQKNSLCHGDFHPENILIDANGQMRVIDWVNSYAGNPLSDVARTYYLMRCGRSPNKRTLLESVLEAVAKPLIANAYLKAYFGKTEFPKKDFRLWLLIVMINRLVKERIAEEAPYLEKQIPKELKKVGREGRN